MKQPEEPRREGRGDRAPPPAIFGAGERVGRYRILRFIARGGAGEVYEAEDLELRSRVALKAIRRDHGSRAGASPAAIERFKREINLARQVTHPNVCRIYEFGHASRRGEDVLFLTMELLEGETLLERIHRGGKLEPAEALPLVRQMAAGLAAAQKAGVVHRDFKSGNVMLVPDATEETGRRVVITDFGLAKSASPTAADLEVTGKHLMIGTPAYMAPEQVAGQPVTPATDLYALGVVLYEMLTAHTPFDADTGLGTAVLRLKEEPLSPRLYTPGIDVRWERAILRCLERHPEDRFATAEEVVAALEAETAEPEPSPAPRGPASRGPTSRGLSGPTRRRGLLAGAAAAVLAAAVGGLFWLSSERGGPALHETAASEPRCSLALLGFRNLSGRAEADWLSTALAEMLATEAAAGDRLRVVPGDDVARVKIELGLDATDRLASSLLARVGEILGTDLVVVGSYLVAGGGVGTDGREIRLDLRVQEAATGEVVASVSDRGTEAGVLDLVESAGRALREALGVGALTAAETRAVRAAFPADSESAKLYARGLAMLRRYDARGALEPLAAAVESDPDNPLIRSALSAAWASLGYGPRAEEEARRAHDLAGDLSRRDRLWVEGRYHDVAGDRRRAVEIYTLLWSFFPDDLEYGLRLAGAQVGTGMAEESLATAARLRRMKEPAGADPRIDLAEAQAARALAQYARQQAAAARAAVKSDALGARLLAARAREVEAGAWRDLGEPDKALKAYEEARGIFAAANNRGRLARLLIAVAKIHRHQGRFDLARELIEEALVTAREIGDQGSIRHALNTLAIILRQQGKLTEAREMHKMELAANREIGDRRSVAVALTSLGVVERRMGDLANAGRRFEEALAIGRETGNLRSVAINLNLLGEVLLRRGEVAAARRHFEEALETNRQTGDPRGRAYYLASLGDADRAAGNLDAARERHTEALEIRRSIGERTNVAYSLLSLAGLELDGGRPARAAERAGEAAAEFETEDKPDAAGYAHSLLAVAWLREGRLAEAAAAIDKASALLGGSENRGYRLWLAVRAAEVAAATAGRQTPGLRRRLAEVIDEAESLGFVDLRLAAGLVLGRLEVESGRGAARLDAVAREASERGFELLARQARTIADG